MLYRINTNWNWSTQKGDSPEDALKKHPHYTKDMRINKVRYFPEDPVTLEIWDKKGHIGFIWEE